MLLHKSQIRELLFFLRAFMAIKTVALLTHLFLVFINSESEDYEDSDSESEDPFTSHQARRQATSGSQRGAMAPFYNYPGAGWTPPFSSAPPLP